MGNKIEFHYNLAELKTLKALRQDMNPEERICLVMDDFMVEIASNKYPNVVDYFTRGRKCGITLFLLSQNFYTIKKQIRNQITYFLFFKMTSKRDVNLIMSEYDNSNKELIKIYNKITETPLQFLKIQATVCDEATKVSRNFTDYIPFSCD